MVSILKKNKKTLCCFFVLYFHVIAKGQIAGKIFNDYNANGQRDSSSSSGFVETGVDGAKVVFKTRNYGQNEHRFDFGFQPTCPATICLPIQTRKN